MTKELTIKSVNGQLVTDSREVAKMIGKRHSDLIRSIDSYNKILLNAKVRSVNFFIESTYKDASGKENKHYLLTRKGCDMVANKMTGEKGVLFTATYVTRFEEMEQQLSNPVQQYLSLSEEDKAIAYFTELKKKKLVEQQLLLAQPKVQKYEQFLDADGYMTGNQVAKSLGIGVKRLYKQLREMSIYKSDNTPYQKYLDKKGYFKVTYKNTPVGIKPVTLITSKGADFIFDLLKQDKTA